MSDHARKIDITRDDLSGFQGRGAAFVTFGETMLRDSPADKQRPETTRLIDIALAGSEYSVTVLMSRLGMPSGYITRVPDNPYGWMLHDNARSHGIDASHFVWAPGTEPIGRYIYEPGRSPRAGVVWYQRMYSAASRLGTGMVNWDEALNNCRLFHTSGITFGLSSHSGYAQNYLLEAFSEAMQHRPANCMVGMDFNYRSTLWSEEECTRVMRPLITNHADVLITSVYDIARHFGIGAGRYSASDINSGKMSDLHDDDLITFGLAVTREFNLKVVAVTMRRSLSSEEHVWEAAAIDANGFLARSPVQRNIMLLDRIGGGDAWNAGFYYGLMTEGFGLEGIRKGVVVGDAATALKQTLMFDLPIVRREEVQALIESDSASGARTIR